MMRKFFETTNPDVIELRIGEIVKGVVTCDNPECKIWDVYQHFQEYRYCKDIICNILFEKLFTEIRGANISADKAPLERTLKAFCGFPHKLQQEYFRRLLDLFLYEDTKDRVSSIINVEEKKFDDVYQFQILCQFIEDNLAFFYEAFDFKGHEILEVFSKSRAPKSFSDDMSKKLYEIDKPRFYGLPLTSTAQLEKENVHVPSYWSIQDKLDYLGFISEKMVQNSLFVYNELALMKDELNYKHSSAVHEIMKTFIKSYESQSGSLPMAFTNNYDVSDVIVDNYIKLMGESKYDVCSLIDDCVGFVSKGKKVDISIFSTKYREVKFDNAFYQKALRLVLALIKSKAKTEALAFFKDLSGNLPINQKTISLLSSLQSDPDFEEIVKKILDDKKEIVQEILEKESLKKLFEKILGTNESNNFATEVIAQKELIEDQLKKFEFSPDKELRIRFGLKKYGVNPTYPGEKE